MPGGDQGTAEKLHRSKNSKLLRARVSLATQEKMRELNFHSCTRIKEIIME